MIGKHCAYDEVCEKVADYHVIFQDTLVPCCQDCFEEGKQNGWHGMDMQAYMPIVRMEEVKQTVKEVEAPSLSRVDIKRPVFSTHNKRHLCDHCGRNYPVAENDGICPSCGAPGNVSEYEDISISAWVS